MAGLDETIGDGVATMSGHRELNWAGLVAKLMTRTDKLFVRKVATQIGHGELNWAELVAGRHTKRTTHANAQALNSGHVKKPQSFDQGCLNYRQTTPAHQRSALTVIVLFNGWLILKFYADKIIKQPGNFLATILNILASKFAAINRKKKPTQMRRQKKL